MLEKLMIIGVDWIIDDPNEVLKKVEELNFKGKWVVFALSHLKPDSKIKQQLAMADDFPMFQKLIQSKWINWKLIFRWDMDIKFWSNFVKSLVNTIDKIKADVARILVDWYPVSINREERNNAITQNSIQNVRQIQSWILSWENILISPWWKRHENLWQDFSLDDSINQETGDFYKLSDWNTQYDNWIKKWFITLARKADTFIVPVFSYIDEGWKYHFVLWNEVSPWEWPKENLNVLSKYLEQMWILKNNVKK